MTNLQISCNQLKQVRELIESVGGDEGRIIIGQRYFRDNGLVIHLRDRYKTENIRVDLTVSDICDIVDEYKNLGGREFEWLRHKANDVQRERIMSRIIDLLIFKATDSEVLQYQVA